MIDREAGVLLSARAADVYSTDQPLAAFHARIAFCMDVHNEVGAGGGGGGGGQAPVCLPGCIAVWARGVQY